MKTIRKPKLTEVAGIKKLLDSAAKTSDVLQRPLMELYENVRDFYTYVDENGIGGCCALHIDMIDLAEIRSLVVREDLRGQDIGVRLLDACLNEARALNIGRVYALTRNQSFFEKQGFAEVEKSELPHKVFNDCVRCPLFPECDEIAMVRTLGVPHESAAELVLGDPRNEAFVGTGLAGTLGFLGFGNMGSAILKGLLDTGAITADRVVVYDVAEGPCAAARGLHARVAASAAELAASSDTLILAVKPQTMAEALDELKPALAPKTLMISIAAGISIGYLQNRLGRDMRVVRVMPNTPALVKTGAAGMALGATCTQDDAATARTIFEAVGMVEMFPEALIDAVTALSGSGPAYFFLMVECLVQAAVDLGMDTGSATHLAAQTMLGAARLLQESGESPSVLRERVTSKGGTTAAALEVFRTEKFSEIVKAAVAAAAARSKELGK